jgi:membrane-bound lytic murein transglycosylase D
MTSKKIICALVQSLLVFGAANVPAITLAQTTTPNSTAAAASTPSPAPAAAVPTAAPAAVTATTPAAEKVSDIVNATATPAAPIEQSTLPAPPGMHPTAAAVVQSEATTPTTVEIVPAPAYIVADSDLWQRIRRGFAMGQMSSPLVQNHEQWYSARPDYIRRFVDRGSRYMYHIVEEVERRGMPMEIVLLPIIESAFNPQANSSAQAAGMWQFIPSTGTQYGLKQDWHTDNRRDVLLSTDAALDYLQKLYKMFNSWELALAAYNCGEGCVGRAVSANARKGLPTDYMSLSLPAETRAYVPKLMAVKNIVLSPASYGVELNSVENRPYFAKVSAPARMDVKLAARLAEMEVEDFNALNPAFTKPVANSGKGYFLVPTDKASVFKDNLDLYKSLNGPMVSWQVAHAKKGDSIDAIARRNGVTASYLRATSGPFGEKKGRFTRPATFMVPMGRESRAMTATLDKKIAINQTRQRTATSVASMAVTAPAPAPSPATAPIAATDTVTETSTKSTTNMMGTESTMSNVIVAENSLPVNAPYILDGKLITPGASTQVVTTAAPAPITSVAPEASTEPEHTERKKAPAAPSIQKHYTVQDGDTLSAISRRFNVSLDNLLRWNKMSTRTRLSVGARVRVAS